jgi:hypothetical protein
MNFVQGVYDFFSDMNSIVGGKGRITFNIPKSAKIISCRQNTLSRYFTITAIAHPHLLPSDNERKFLFMSSNQENVATTHSETLDRYICTVEALHVFEITEETNGQSRQASGTQ